MLEEHIKTISKSILFKDIEISNIAQMIDCLEPRLLKYKKSDYIFVNGDYFSHLGIIVEGKAAVIKESLNGERVIVNTLNESDIFGEIIAFSGLDNWPNTVQALEKTKIILLPKNKITAECSKVCQWHKALIDNFLNVLSEKALILNKKIEYLSIKGIRKKVSTYLYEQYEKKGSTSITLDLNRNELAGFLNVSRPSMSRELSKMREEKVIDFHLKSIEILNLNALKSIISM